MMTCSQTEKSDIAQLQESIAALTTAFTEFKTNQDLRHETYLNTFQTLQTQQLESQSNSPIVTATPLDTIKPPKLVLPFFDGSNPLDWVFQANQFFTHYGIAQAQRLTHIACYMSGDALGWYQWMHHNICSQLGMSS